MVSLESRVSTHARGLGGLKRDPPASASDDDKRRLAILPHRMGQMDEAANGVRYVGAASNSKHVYENDVLATAVKTRAASGGLGATMDTYVVQVAESRVYNSTLIFERVSCGGRVHLAHIRTTRHADLWAAWHAACEL